MQRYLLDTQVLIWALTSPLRLTPGIITLLSINAIFVSHVSLLEIAIKQKIGKLPELPISISELEKVILADGFGLIPISAAHGNFKIYEKIISLLRSISSKCEKAR